MNVISKKLLSLLVVMAMVLSMVPVISMPALAAEATVAEAVTPGQANLPEGVQEIIDEAAKVVNTDAAIDAHIAKGTCPMCGAAGITWEHKTAGTNLDTVEEIGTYHFYYDSECTISGNVIGIYGSAENTSACIALKSTALIKNTGTRFGMLGRADCEVNIMGSGKVITNVGTGGDYGIFQVGGGVLNLYGGQYILEDVEGGSVEIEKVYYDSDYHYAAIRANGGDVNIFNDTIIGADEVDTTKVLYNLSINSASSEVKMYGGVIQNGVTNLNGRSGNVTITSSGNFYLYGGEIKNGQYLAGEGLTSPASCGGNVVVGGWKEGPITNKSTGGNFYMYGGTVSGGKANNGGNGGGNIVLFNAEGYMELMGGIVKDGWAKADGGNIQIQQSNSAKLPKIGGTVLITNGEAPSGGNIQVEAWKTLNIEGGFITGGAKATSNKNATNGGGIYLGVKSTLNMTGGTIDGCTASGNGGSIYSYGATLNIGENAVIKNGLSKSASNGGGGGNVYATTGNYTSNNVTTTVGTTMTTSGVITGGVVNGGETMQSSGGNISVVASGAIQSTLTVNGGEISGGELAYATAGSSFGGNIRSYNCKVIINDGLIYGGKAGTKAGSSVGVLGGTSTSANTNNYLEINGGVIVGDIQCNAKASNSTATGTNGTVYTYTATVKLTGSPKIVSSYTLANGTKVSATNGGLYITSGCPVDISGLSAGAKISVSGTLNTVLTEASENAANVVKCFSSYTSGRGVELQSDNTLKLVEKIVKDPVKGVFEPWNCDGMAYCDACLKQGKSDAEALVAWTVYDGSNDNSNIKTDAANAKAHYHLYLDKDMTYSTQFYVTHRNTCFNLNGCDVTATADADLAFSGTQMLNIMDTKGGAVVTGNGSALYMNGGNASATYNIYGGTYTKLASNTTASVVTIGNNGGTLNLHGGVIDASGTSVTSGSLSAAVSVIGKTGGANPAAFNMHGGEIIGGTAPYGGSVFLTTGAATFTMSGGKIHGGTATAAGGNISSASYGTINISGGEIYGGHVSTNTGGGNWGGNIRAWNTNVTISGGLIYGGTGGKQLAGANVSCYSDATGRDAGFGVLTISGGTIVGDVATTEIAGYITTKLSGKPTIVTSMEIDGITYNAINGGLALGNSRKADITGLNADAEIVVSAALGAVITVADNNAANVAKCFTSYTSGHVIEAQADNTLKVVVKAPKVGVFDPWNYDGMAYCPVCYENGTNKEAVAWTAIDNTYVGGGYLAAGAHVYLAEDITTSIDSDKTAYITPPAYKIACVNFNGCDLTVTNGRVFFGGNGTLNLMDTAEEQGTISGYLSSAGNATTILLNGGSASGTVNIYGGIFTKSAEDTNSPVVCISDNGGTINMYGGIIDGGNIVTEAYPGCVYLTGSGVAQYSGKAIFNMYGGTIQNGSTSKAAGGNIRIGSNSAEKADRSYCGVAEFNLYDGTIKDGSCSYEYHGGGNIAVYGNTLNIYGGLISGGKLTTEDGKNNNLGGNIYAGRKEQYKANAEDATTYGNATINMTAGIIENGKAGETYNNGGNIGLDNGSVMNMSGGEIRNGVAGNQGGNMRVYYATFNMSGDAQVSCGNAVNSNTDNVWLIGSDMTMSDNAAVYTVADSLSTGNGIQVGAYLRGSTLTLSGNATVKSISGETKNIINVAYAADYANTLMIDNDWTGEAYFATTTETGSGYQRGQLIANRNVICGSLVDGVPTKGGTFSGKLYYGPQLNTPVIGKDGDVYVGLAVIKAADGDQWFLTNEEAFAAYYANNSFEKGEYIMLSNENPITLAGDTYIDSRGYEIKVYGEGTLYAMDNANDDYVGYGTWTIMSENVEVATDVQNSVKDRRYIVIEHAPDADGNRKISAHRLEMRLSAVSLRTSAAGIYYKAAYSCDTVLAGRISAYGVAMSLQDMPGADFRTDSRTLYSWYDSGLTVNADNNFTVTATSGAVFGIFKGAESGRSAETNAAYGKMKIYANPYILVNTQNDKDASNDIALVADNENAGQKAGIAHSLFDLLKYIDKNWEKNQKIQEQITAFYNEWASMGMSLYADEFENIA